MNEIFAKILYEYIVEENLKEYKRGMEDKDVYFGNVYEKLTDDEKELTVEFIETIIIDTISNVFAITDGASIPSVSKYELYDFDVDILLNGVSTDKTMQDYFLEYVEIMEENR